MKSVFNLFTCAVLVSTAATFSYAENNEPAMPVTGTEASVMRVFSCGHSFHWYVPAMLAEMAKSAGIDGHVIIGTSIIGGSKSITHWNVNATDNSAKEALNAGKVDVLTLTPIYLPDEGIEKFAQLGLEKNPNIRVTVQEFWLPYDQNEPHFYDPPLIPCPETVNHNAATGDGLRNIHKPYFKDMDDYIDTLNKRFGKQVLFAVPVGQAVIALREKIIAGQAPGLKVQEDLFIDPLGHPNVPLQVLVVYCHFAVIYGRSPVGLPVPGALMKAEIPHADELNRMLQELAWEAVINHPLSGVKK